MRNSIVKHSSRYQVPTGESRPAAMEWPKELQHLKQDKRWAEWECVDILEDFITDTTTFVLIKPPSKDRHYYQLRIDGSEGFAPVGMMCKGGQDG